MMLNFTDGDVIIMMLKFTDGDVIIMMLKFTDGDVIINGADVHRWCCQY